MVAIELDVLRARIQALLSSGREICEDGELLFNPGEASFRVEEAHGRLLLHLWSAERTWVRCVAGIAEEQAERLVLEVERFGRGQSGRLALAPPRRVGLDSERAGRRRKYSAWLRRLLAREFPGATVQGLSSGPDLKRSFSALYTRAALHEGNRWWALVAVSAAEGAAAADGLLTFALVWLDWNSRRFPERSWAGLRLFLPEERLATTLSRLAALSPALTVEVYATKEGDFSCWRVDGHVAGNLATELLPAGRANEILGAESTAVERIRTLAPDEIELVPAPGRGELSLRFHGLEFARSRTGQVSFGLGPEVRQLTPRNFSRLEALVRRLAQERAAGARATTRLYRLQPERWLESLVCSAPHRVDPRLEPGRLHRQVPAMSGSERGVVDLLGVTRDGQLVVIELKASTDIHLALQGVDYWLRVRWHQQQGELVRRGYLAGVPVKPDPPELLLVSPGLQFHPATELCLGYLSPEVRWTIVGLGEDWRRELRVVFRRRRD